MTDPYTWSDGCLRNKLDIRDRRVLAVIEARIVTVRDAVLARETLPGEYNLEHLQRFHYELFRDVYDWAGETRTVDIAKVDVQFCHWRFVAEQTTALLAQLEDDNWLTGKSRDAFMDRLAYYYGELNARHPFREGNGRAQRAFLRQLAAAAGWRLDWSALDGEANIMASQHSWRTADHSPLRAVLEPVVFRI